MPITQRALAAIALGLGLLLPAARPTQAAEAVDVALVLAVDISYSMDAVEQRLQRDGYIEALNSPEVLTAIAAGPNHRIAITYVEWAGSNDQTVLVPWHVIDGPQSARAVTDELASKPYRRAARTSIAGGLAFSATLFDSLGGVASRRVIDVSGDGPNNAGPPVTEVRAGVLARGIVINGLPIIWRRNAPNMMDIDNLADYYETCVIGGDAAFVVPVKSRDTFSTATRLKLLQEVAGTHLAPHPIAVAASDTDCLIGEKLWQQHFGTFRN
ncbi:MAG: DUF1194 domain-containing protein [Ancalomicrobiaceae bacterium]|nr:DUF1194 domain-containing protein [Ancalomicrobiaceae bacterium]